MKKSARQKIVIVGCGNLAWHLAKHFHAEKKSELFVYNHQSNPLLKEFSSKLNCKTDASLDSIIADAEIYFICVADKHIRNCAKKINARNPNALLVHTSGSIKGEELGKRVHDTGVFYPLQTFSRHVSVDWSELPIIVESAGKDSVSVIKLAERFTKNVVQLPYKDRLKLHLSAVLVNNFTNALYVAAGDLLHEKSPGVQLNFDLLLPLIKQTSLKIETVNARAAQTGPAKRRDEGVIRKHLHLLNKHPEIKKLYKQLSKLIVKQQER